MDFLLMGRLAVIAGFVLLVGWAIHLWVSEVVGAINGVRAAIQSHSKWLQQSREDDLRAARWMASDAKQRAAEAPPANRPLDNEKLAPAARELIAGLGRDTIPPRTR